VDTVEEEKNKVKGQKSVLSKWLTK